MSEDRIEAGRYELTNGSPSLPEHVLVISVNGQGRIVARAYEHPDEGFQTACRAAASSAAGARMMWEMAKGGPR